MRGTQQARPSTSGSALDKAAMVTTSPPLLTEMRGALAAMRGALKSCGIELPRVQGPPADALRLVATAEHKVLAELSDVTVGPERRADLASALSQFRLARAVVHSAAAAHRSIAVASILESLSRSHASATVDHLIEAIPQQAAELGYDRMLLSQIRGNRWLPICGYVRDDPNQTDAMIDVVRQAARPIDQTLIEFDILNRKKPILVLDAHHNGRVHPELLALTSVRSYASAPIMIGSTVVGFVHADASTSDRQVAPADGAILGLLGVALGFTLERAILNRRLERISQLADGPGKGWGPPRGAHYDSRPLSNQRPAQVHKGVMPRRTRPLSPREIDVLRHLVRGDSNVTIAIAMGIAETTVKTHVKHILRKLGLENRIELIGLPIDNLNPAIDVARRRSQSMIAPDRATLDA